MLPNLPLVLSSPTTKAGVLWASVIITSLISLPVMHSQGNKDSHGNNAFHTVFAGFMFEREESELEPYGTMFYALPVRSSRRFHV